MTKARLIKRDLSGPKDAIKPPVDAQQMSDSVWSWVHQFRVTRDDQARSDFRRLKYPEKS